MSVKWNIIGSNALENWNPKYFVSSISDRKKIEQKQKWTSFKEKMAIDRMPVVKEKHHYKKDDGKDTIKDLKTYNN